MKKEFILVVMILILSLQLAIAQDYPKIVPYVNDFGGYLNSQQIESLNLRCDAIQKNTSYEIALVTVKTTNGQDRLDYANRIGENNGVGKLEASNGLVLLWTQEDEKGIAIAVGRGAESTFNDAKVSRYARDARPLFDEGKYYEGFNKMLDDIEAELKVNPDPIAAIDIPDTKDLTGLIIMAAIIIIIFWVICKVFDIDTGGMGTGIVIGSILRGGGGGGGFSGGSFSGGSFGGGGGRG